MNSIPQTTRYHAVKTYRNGASVDFIYRRYKVSKTSIMRWNKRFDGTKDYLKDRSHHPKTQHQTSHTPEEMYILQCNEGDSLLEPIHPSCRNR